MKLDAITYGHDLSAVPDTVGEVEARGYDGWMTSEVTHDPFLAMALAAEHTTELEIGSAIAVAFARNPMTVAYAAQDLQRLSGGRTVLGLGSQIEPHITKRFSSQWSHPAPRMREFVQALRAIWEAWNQGTDLEFEGQFYTHTLMTPFFAPEPVESGAPTVWIAGVGPLMTEVAGEVGDGLLCHAFTTERYLREETVPAIAKGATGAGRSPEEIEVVLPVMPITGYDDDQTQAMEEAVRSQIGFYGSTPAYRKVLEVHGWGDLQDELNRLSKEGEWAEMAERIDDEVVDAFAVRAEPDELGAAIVERFGDLADRIALYESIGLTDDHWERFRSDLA